MSKLHYVVPHQMPQGRVGQPLEIVTVYEPACRQSGLQVHGTTNMARVTCKRCQHYLSQRPATTP
jgi:hypothetical protein